MFEGTDWTTVFVAAVSGFTGLAGASVSLVLHYSEGARARKSVRAALIAEVGALAYLLRENAYADEMEQNVQELQERLETARRSNQNQVVAMDYEVPVPENYNLIYRENVSRLGVLKPREAEQIVLFYQLLQSVKADVSPGGYLADGTVEVEKVESTIHMLRSALNLADQLSGKGSRWTFCGLSKK